MNRTAAAAVLAATLLTQHADAQTCDAEIATNIGGIVRDMDHDAGIVYVMTQDNGLQIFDIKTPGQPKLLSSLLTADYPAAIAKSADILYIASSFSGIFLTDVSDPSAPISLPPVFQNSDTITDITVNGNLLYATGERFWIFDITDPTSPIQTAALELPDYAGSFARAGTNFYLSDDGDSFIGPDTLYSIDASNPAAPTVNPGFYQH